MVSRRLFGSARHGAGQLGSSPFHEASTVFVAVLNDGSLLLSNSRLHKYSSPPISDTEETRGRRGKGSDWRSRRAPGALVPGSPQNLWLQSCPRRFRWANPRVDG